MSDDFDSVVEFRLPDVDDPWRCPRCAHWIPDDKHPGAYPGPLSHNTAAPGGSGRRGPQICTICGREEGMLRVRGYDLGQETWPITINPR